MSGRFGSRPYIQNTNATVATSSAAPASATIAPHLRIVSHSLRGGCFAGLPRLAGLARLGVRAAGRGRRSAACGSVASTSSSSARWHVAVGSASWDTASRERPHAAGLSHWLRRRFATRRRVRRDTRRATRTHPSLRSRIADGAADLEREPARAQPRRRSSVEIAERADQRAPAGRDPAHRERDRDADRLKLSVNPNIGTPSAPSHAAIAASVRPGVLVAERDRDRRVDVDVLDRVRSRRAASRRRGTRARAARATAAIGARPAMQVDPLVRAARDAAARRRTDRPGSITCSSWSPSASVVRIVAAALCGS